MAKSRPHTIALCKPKSCWRHDERLSSLDTGLTGLANGVTHGAMTEGELRRRQDMLTKLKDDRDVLLKLISAGRQELDMLYSNNASNGISKSAAQEPSVSDRRTLLGDSNGQIHSMAAAGQPNGLTGMQSRKDMVRRGRAFGAAAKQAPVAETAETRVLDEEGLVQYQRQRMADQDLQLEQFNALLERQKHIGLAIGDELENTEPDA